MDAVLVILFASPTGLLSLFTISFIIVMGFFMRGWIKRKMNAPQE